MNRHTALVIGASSESLPAILKARKNNIYVIAFDGSETAEGLAAADTSYVVDIRKPELILDALNDIKPDFVLPVPIGRYLTTTGAVNDKLKLKGISAASANACTDKWEFHNRLAKEGLRNAYCRLIQNGEIISSLNDIFPLIFKPRYGSGSREVIYISSYDEFEKLFHNKQTNSNKNNLETINSCFNSNKSNLKTSKDYIKAKEDYIVESFIDGTEYGIDGAVIDKQFYIILVRKKLLTKLPYRQCTGYITVFKTLENSVWYDKLYEYVRLVCSACELNNCLFHADIIDNKKEFFAVEISGRPSGHKLHNLFTPLATGTDMIQEYINFQLGLNYDFNPKYSKNMIIRFFDFENCYIRKLPDENMLKDKYNIIDYCCNIGNEYLETVTNGASLIHRGYFIITGKDEYDLINQCDSILSEFKTDF